MEIWQSFFLGIVEGITEFLPISSTAHLILFSKILRIEDSDFAKSFDIIIQFGAIFAVIFLYYKKILDINIWKKILVAFLPTGIIGLLTYRFIKSYFFSNHLFIASTLLIGGLILILFETYYRRKNMIDNQFDLNSISYKQSFIIGIFQSLAVIPGVSRSASTIVGGLILGLPRVLIVEFSFLLAIPTILSAVGLDLIKNYKIFSTEQVFILVLGFLSAFFTSILCINFLLKFIKQNDFIYFGIYRVVIGILFIVYIIF